MCYRINILTPIIILSIAVAGRSDTTSQQTATEPERGTLEYVEQRSLSGRRVYTVGRALTYTSIIPMYIGSLIGDEVPKLGVTFIPISAAWGLTALTVNHAGMARNVSCLRRICKAYPDNRELRDELRQYRIRYVNGGLLALAGATSMTFGAVLGPIDGPQFLIPLTLAGYALIGLRDVLWTRAINGSINVIKEAREQHSTQKIMACPYVPKSGGLGIRVSLGI